MRTTEATAPTVCPLVPSAQSVRPEPVAAGLRYEIAQSRQDLHDAFALVYQTYRTAGIVVPNECGIRLTPFHLLPTTEVFVTKLDETVVSTVSLIGDGKLGLPSESIYQKNVDLIRNRGLRMAEIGSLADRRESPVRFIETFATMVQMLAQVAMRRRYDGLVAVVRPKHARLYQRIFGLEQIGRQVNCPYANGTPAVMLALVFDDVLGSDMYERFFGSMSNSRETSSRPWSKETYRYFEQFV